MFHNGARRARVIFRRALDLFPWTPLGLCVVALALGTLQWFAFSQLDLVWLVVGSVALALAVLSPASAAGAAAWLRLPPDAAGAGPGSDRDRGGGSGVGVRWASTEVLKRRGS